VQGPKEKKSEEGFLKKVVKKVRRLGRSTDRGASQNSFPGSLTMSSESSCPSYSYSDADPGSENLLETGGKKGEIEEGRLKA